MKISASNTMLGVGARESPWCYSRSSSPESWRLNIRTSGSPGAAALALRRPLPQQGTPERPLLRSGAPATVVL